MKTSDLVRIVWVDDDENNLEITQNLRSKRKELRIEFISKSNEFEDFLAKQNDVDLFLVDDQLTLQSDSPFNRRGLSVVAQIREKFPEIPVYMFSAVKVEGGIYTALAEAAESLADNILELKEIQRRGHEILYYDSLDYRKIRETSRESVKALLKLLNAPDDDHARIISALPESLKKGLSPKSKTARAEGNAIAFAKWVKRVFLKLPGFVYNSLYAATMLGITEEAFHSLEHKFKEARYSGVFEKTSPNLWWGSSVRDVVFRISCAKEPESGTTDLKQLTKQLFRIRQSQISKCAVCGENYPETVGINKEDETDLKPVHYRCSIPHPTKTRILYFDEARQFSEVR